MNLRTLLVLLFALGCNGVIGDPGATEREQVEGLPPVDAPALDADGLGNYGLHRLSRIEYRDTVESLFDVEMETELVELLPPDGATPFDNDETQQVASAALVEGVKAVADRIAARVIADTDARDALVGCTPSSAGDRACFESFLTRFGRRALRRPLTLEEVLEFTDTLIPEAEAEGDFYVAVELTIRAMLQHPELLHRIEIGTPIDGKPGLLRLSSWELAARMSYFLWGTGPDDELLDVAESGGLDTPGGVREAALRMVDDPRAHERMARFHAMWFGYDQRAGEGTRSAMRVETDTLLARVLFEERRPWPEIFTFPETFVSPELAEHYGLPSPGGEAGWVTYPDTRGGILSHGMLLSNGAKFGDTSPVGRGQFVRERLLCQPLPPPPPDLMVDVDEAPGNPDDCKPERYAEHRTSAGCAGCHSLVDPIGFGLENYDTMGRFRTHEVDNPTCEIAGDGEVVGIGEFSGPGELGTLLSDQPELRQCMISHLYRFAVGRPETERDANTLAVLEERFEALDHDFVELVLDIVTSQAFSHRLVEVEL